MQIFERLARSDWPLYPIGIIYLLFGASQLASFFFGRPGLKWIQLPGGIGFLLLAVLWLTAGVTRTKAQRKARDH